MGRVKLQAEPDFWVLLFLGLLLDRDGLALTIALAWVLHELGHLVPMILWGCTVRVRLTALGATMQPQSRKGLSYGRELVAVLLGPGVNLACARLCAVRGDGGWPAAGVHLILGAFNLLPLPSLDGGRVLELLGKLLFEKQQKNENNACKREGSMVKYLSLNNGRSSAAALSRRKVPHKSRNERL